MQYARLGNTGLIVSRLAFGVMTFGNAEGPIQGIWKTGQDEADKLVTCALNAGINLFDTADSYASGQSEAMLGKALGERRKDVVLSTKAGFRSGGGLLDAGGSFRHVVNSVESSLRRLNTHYIDLLSIHRSDPYTPFEETARALDHVVTRGLVRYVGFSNFTAWQAAKFRGIQKQMGYSPLVAAQMYYSLVGRDIEHEVVPFCQDAGIGIVVWSPLASCFLSGRYTRQDPTGGKGRLATFDILPFDREKGYALIDRMREIAQQHKASVSQIALAWLLAKSHVTSILLGASKVSQLEDNLRAEGVTLSEQELAELDQRTAPNPLHPNWFQSQLADTVAQEALASRSTKEKG